MATNPYVNKVIYGNDTVMDISDTTATESDVANGKAFYKSSGARATGTASLDSAVWGNITGTLADQTDLQDELDAKLPTSVAYRNDTVAYPTDNINDSDYFPYYDTTSSQSKSAMWSNIKNKIRAFLDGYYTYPIERGLVTATAGTAIRIPASGTTSHITTNSRVIPMAEAKSDGTPYKYSSIKVYDGYLEIKLAENISNLTIGVLVVNYSD